MSVVEIAPRIHRIDSRMNTRRLSQWLIVGDQAALLFDTGISGTVRDHVAPALAELDLDPARLTDVVISHADVDHYGGNAEIRELAPQARLRAHRLDRPLIESWARIAGERYGWYRDHGLDYPPPAWDWLETAAGADVRLDGEVEPGESIDLGGVALEVLYLPGHSRGHIGLIDRAGETAIIADAVMGLGFETVEGAPAGPPPYVDLDAYRRTIEAVRTLGAARLGTAHFPLFEGAEIDRFCNLSRELTDRIEAAIDEQPPPEGDPVAALLAPVARSLGGYPEMEVELARSIGAHLEARRALTSTA